MYMNICEYVHTLIQLEHKDKFKRDCIYKPDTGSYLQGSVNTKSFSFLRIWSLKIPGLTGRWGYDEMAVAGAVFPGEPESRPQSGTFSALFLKKKSRSHPQKTSPQRRVEREALQTTNSKWFWNSYSGSSICKGSVHSAWPPGWRLFQARRPPAVGLSPHRRP